MLNLRYKISRLFSQTLNQLCAYICVYKAKEHAELLPNCTLEKP